MTHHIKVEDLEKRIRLGKESGICYCDTCIAARTPPSNISQGGGKPLPSLEQILELEEVEKHAQQNFKNIKIVNGQAQCQRCFMFVRLIPSGSSIEIETHKKRQLKLDDPKLTGKRKQLMQYQLDKFEEKLRRRNPNNIPLYRYRSGEIWMCGRCLEESQKRTI